MNDEFQTPREALLIAENKRLKAENNYLRQGIEHHFEKITPVAAIGDAEFYKMPDTYTLPACADIRGSLASTGNYHVIATIKNVYPEDIQIKYFADAKVIRLKAHWMVNELMPYLHERFIHALAKAIVKDL